MFRGECEANYDWRVMIKFRVCVIMLSNMFIPKAESSVAAYPSNALTHPRLSAMSALSCCANLCAPFDGSVHARGVAVEAFLQAVLTLPCPLPLLSCCVAC